jgi:hypothetical protein
MTPDLTRNRAMHEMKRRMPDHWGDDPHVTEGRGHRLRIALVIGARFVDLDPPGRGLGAPDVDHPSNDGIEDAIRLTATKSVSIARTTDIGLRCMLSANESVPPAPEV